MTLKKTLLLVCLTLVAMALSGCRKDVVLQRILPKLDPALTEVEKKALLETVDRLGGLEVEIPQKSIARKIFKTSDMRGVYRFLDQRVNYIVTENGDYIDRLVTFARLKKNHDEDEVETIAENIGIELWMSREINRIDHLGFTFGSEVVPITSSRVGLIRIGKAFVESMLPVERIATLVHEARHSDCTGGATRKEMELYLSNEYTQGTACGHLHALCPEGHPYAGHFACDDRAWGAYAIEAAFAAAAGKNCKRCAEVEKQLLLMTAADSLSRVLILDDMLSGKLGAPDLSSSGVRD